ncbi:hypothetical protein ACOMHN_019780 [Nucella lapillus]
MSTVDGVTELTDDDGKAVGRPWDTSDPFVDVYTRVLVVTVFKCYVRQATLLIGVPGNAICCVVFWKQGLSDRINLLLFWQAVIDFLHLALQVPTMITCYSSDSILNNNVDIILSTKIIRMYVACGAISGVLAVVMSVERCLHVVFPIRARRLLTYRSMVLAILLSFIIPFLAYFPSFLIHKVKWRLDPSTNRSIAYMAPDPTWFPAKEISGDILKYLTFVDFHIGGFNFEFDS